MNRMTWMALAIAVGLLPAPPALADLKIDINLAPPPLVVAAPPPMVLVPGTAVHHVPSVSFNLFVYGGRYYSFHNGVWFSAASHNAPWIAIATDRVPKPVLGVPATYYKIPPGQAKKMKDGGPDGPPGRVGVAVVPVPVPATRQQPDDEQDP